MITHSEAITDAFIPYAQCKSSHDYKPRRSDCVAIVPYPDPMLREARRIDKYKKLWWNQKHPHTYYYYGMNHLYEDAHRKVKNRFAPEFLSKDDAAWIRKLSKQISSCLFMPVVPLPAGERLVQLTLWLPAPGNDDIDPPPNYYPERIAS